jgi:hypothetical protein
MRFIPVVILFSFFLFSCVKTAKKSNPQQAKLNSTKITKQKGDNKTKKDSEEAKDDSIQLKLMLKDAFNVALNHKRNSKFSTKLAGKYKDWNSASLKFGYLFDKEKKHLIVKRQLHGSEIDIDVFVLNKSKFRLLLNWSGLNLYLDNTVRDVNGDGLKDFLIHTYPPSGCCRRDVYEVYLYNKNNGRLTPGYRFINPTFFPSQKIIRGVGYGQPGEVELYKYRWHNLKVDTVEFIFPDTLTKKFRLFKHWSDAYNPEKGKLLTSVPKEYYKIESYKWFRGIY